MVLYFVCILLLVYFATLFSYLYFVLASLAQIAIRKPNILLLLGEPGMRFLWLLSLFLEYLHKRDLLTFIRSSKMIIISANSFFMVTLYLLLIRSGIEVNPGPTDLFCDIFANLKRDFILAHLNIQNLLSKNGTKLDEIALLLKRSAQLPLVLGLSETWLLKRNATSLITFENYYQPFRKDRNIKVKGRPEKGGGILVYVSKLLHAKRRHDLESKTETLWIEISGRNIPRILVCNFYKHKAISIFSTCLTHR